MLLKNLHHKLVLQAPQLLRLPVSLIPFAAKKAAMVFILQRVFKEALEDGDFEFLEDRLLKVSVDDLQLSCFITLQQGQLLVQEQSDSFDVSFAAGLNDLILIAGRKEDPDSLFFQRRLRIEGDTELGLEVKNLIDSLDLDELPKIVRLALNDLALFVQKGIQTPEMTLERAATI
ncbi:putative lipid carrier protein YhbT [Tolumonas osonensis]|uniref:Ubiquinone biosynthesis accessory factor UbiT n=1 Tax=Tolumonas osonensis TaxID=675874 RepID=A0A841GR09_9GAMM|nr:SCP2 sterol-binding domain-containing protein [Tolumonas osonensis]MBB6056063.1 putative lipid carrier protein YhbT [Tolumonas osonensis]